MQKTEKQSSSHDGCAERTSLLSPTTTTLTTVGEKAHSLRLSTSVFSTNEAQIMKITTLKTKCGKVPRRSVGLFGSDLSGEALASIRVPQTQIIKYMGNQPEFQLFHEEVKVVKVLHPNPSDFAFPPFVSQIRVATRCEEFWSLNI